MRWVRAIISLIAICGITWGFAVGKIQSEAYLTLMAVAVTWWFKSRDNEKDKPASP